MRLRMFTSFDSAEDDRLFEWKIDKEEQIGTDPPTALEDIYDSVGMRIRWQITFLKLEFCGTIFE